MRTRRRLTWIIFAVCILAVVEGLAWVTWHALRLEKRERQAQAGAQFQQAIRLALWRMESEVTPIIAAEAARPYFHYIPFYPAERAYTKMFQQVKANEVLVPSPLLETSGRFIRLHFQIDPDGVVTSPQAPTGNMRDMAEAQYLDSEFIVLAGQMLDEVAAMVRGPAQGAPVAQGQLSAAVPPPGQFEEQAQIGAMVQSEAPAQVWRQEDAVDFKARERAAQTAQTMNIAEQRRKSPVEPATETRADLSAEAAKEVKLAAVPPATTTATKEVEAPSAAPPPPPAGVGAPAAVGGAVDGGQTRSLLKDYQPAGPQAELSRVEQGGFEAKWYSSPRTGEDELVLERSVVIDGREIRQGLWIDWPQLRDQLKTSVEDLLPDATLCAATDTGESGHRPPTLASVPVRLLPGPMPPVAGAAWSPTHITLLVTWMASVGAIGAIAIVLRKAMELSERRGRFVSAVTHELRTPLTTFCLYTEMLSDGMVTDEAARKQYLGTLKSESNRLARIVQNVLDYAGIGGVGRRTPGPAAEVGVSELLERLRPALERCAEKAGMELVYEIGAMDASVRADPQTVERILVNLVENAGKYASEAADRRIHITVHRVKMGNLDAVQIAVRDHGPGVPKSERRMIFSAFHRATRDAAGPKSGLGLGLALARELARELSGRLTLDSRVTDGASFVLTIPARYRP